MHGYNVAKDIAIALLSPEFRRLDSEIEKLNAANKEVKRLAVDGFIYGGLYFLPKTGTRIVAGAGRAKPTLHFSLVDRMETWLKDNKAIIDDSSLIRQMLFRLLSSCRNETEVRNALPECLVSLVQGLSSLHRSDEVAYTLAGDERAKRQFEKILPRMEFYSATRLIY